MTNKTKGFVGAAVVVAAATVTGIVVKRDHAPEPYAFHGFAESSQQATASFSDGTNQYELLFEFNPDKVDANTNHPGIVLVFMNGERIGTNIIAGFRRNMEPAELSRLTTTARLAEAR